MPQDPLSQNQPVNTPDSSVTPQPTGHTSGMPQPILPEQDPETGIVASEGGARGRGWRGVASTILILLAAPLIAVALTAFVFQSYEVDGQSMNTTLEHQDRLIIWKVPRTLSRITKHDYVPSRGDVIVFVKHGLYEEGGGEKQLIKRVIGLPGERVVVANGKITVYNQENPKGFDPDLNKEFSDGIVTPTLIDTDIKVGEDEVFVCGDNRGNSLDSRSFGTVKSHDIVGRMVLRIFPIGGFKSYI